MGVLIFEKQRRNDLLLVICRARHGCPYILKTKVWIIICYQFVGPAMAVLLFWKQNLIFCFQKVPILKKGGMRIQTLNKKAFSIIGWDLGVTGVEEGSTLMMMMRMLLRVIMKDRVWCLWPPPWTPPPSPSPPILQVWHLGGVT